MFNFLFALCRVSVGLSFGDNDQGQAVVVSVAPGSAADFCGLQVLNKLILTFCKIDSSRLKFRSAVMFAGWG